MAAPTRAARVKILLANSEPSTHGGIAAVIDSRAQSSRLAEFGGRVMSFNICRGTIGSLAMFTAMRNASSHVSSFALERRPGSSSQ